MRSYGDSGDEQVKTTPDVRDAATPQRLLAFWEGGQTALPLPAHGLLTVGRAAECEVRIDHPSVSRRHVVLHLGTPPSVEDLGSSNGTRMGGRRLEAGVPTAMRPGEVVEIGSAMLVLQSGSELPAAVGSEAVGATVRPPPPTPSAEGLVVRCAAMERVHRLLELVAQGSISVLLLGETGVGKEIAAEVIHRRSPRSGRPFLAVNCAALPEPLLESELFGHERGAFTGAVHAKAGLLEAASGGTLFLDEIGDLPPATQAKLLRVVETRQVTRLGGLSPRTFDVRFVSATNKNLDEAIRTGAFRQDLFFRLSGVSVVIPALRERREEIEPLAALFAARAAAELGRAVPALSLGARGWLEAQPWPGNLRELRNVVERAVLVAPGAVIDVEHLCAGASVGAYAPGAPADASARPPAPPPPPSSGARGDGLRSEMELFERQRIADALARCDGNQTLAARMLGISRRTLIERLDSYQLPRPRKGKRAR